MMYFWDRDYVSHIQDLKRESYMQWVKSGYRDYEAHRRFVLYYNKLCSHLQEKK
jgi:hypothetical protein